MATPYTERVLHFRLEAAGPFPESRTTDPNRAHRFGTLFEGRPRSRQPFVAVARRGERIARVTRFDRARHRSFEQRKPGFETGEECPGAFAQACGLSHPVGRIMAFQNTPHGLDFSRRMMGVDFGAEVVTIDTCLSELVQKHVRGRAFALNQFVTYRAVPVIDCLAWRLVPSAPFGFDGWR